MTVTTLSHKGPSGRSALAQSEGRVVGEEVFVPAHWVVNEASWLLQGFHTIALQRGGGEGIQGVGQRYHDSIKSLAIRGAWWTG